MDQQIKSMLESGLLEKAECTPTYLSTFFFRPKTDGSIRPILNLKELNRFVMTKVFQLFSHYRVPSFLQNKD